LPLRRFSILMGAAATFVVADDMTLVPALAAVAPMPSGTDATPKAPSRQPLIIDFIDLSPVYQVVDSVTRPPVAARE
jgi:hypothetical protein